MKKRLLSFRLHIQKIGFFQTVLYLLQRIFFKKDSLIKLKIKELSNPIYLRNKSYDTHIFYQIFMKEEVNFNLNRTPHVIFDCGANIGLSTLYFKRKFPAATIYSIEPESSNFEVLKLNTEKYLKINLVHAALWNKECFINIIDNGEGNASFITKEGRNGGNIIELTPTITMEMLIERIQNETIDLIKMDIEGSEFDIFTNDIDPWIKYTRNIAIEFHESIRPGVKKLIFEKLSGKFTDKNIGEYVLFKRNNSLGFRS